MAKLLLLDDEPEILEWMTAALATLGHDVRASRSARAALGIVQSWAPDLIVSDILMPEMDGLAFARIVRASGGPPIIFVSIAMKKAEAILAGAVGVVRKPATADDVRRAVEDVLGRDPKRSVVLVVDDEHEVREVYRDFLEHRFEVLEAKDGADALEILHARHVDLMISDVHMPRMNGVELIRAVRADPDLEELPIIIQTADRAALAAPIWNELDVPHRIEKLGFIRWLHGLIEMHRPRPSPGRPSVH